MSTNHPIRWADAAQFQAAPIRGDKPRVYLLWATPDPLGAIASMCRMYEGKPTYHLEEILESERIHYWEQANKTHLKAPLEAVVFHWFIEGVDRSFTHQMVRQRTACFAQESLRFAVKDSLSSEVLPPITILPGSDQEQKWNDAIAKVEEAYNYLVNNGIPAEDARGLLPHAVPTRLNYITNLRSLLDHAGNRLCTQAQFVWRDVFNQMVGILRKRGGHYREMADSGVFKPICFQMGHCPFKASFDRDCTIRERVDAGQFDQIADAEWALNPEAGRTH